MGAWRLQGEWRERLLSVNLPLGGRNSSRDVPRQQFTGQGENLLIRSLTVSFVLDPNHPLTEQGSRHGGWCVMGARQLYTELAFMTTQTSGSQEIQ